MLFTTKFNVTLQDMADIALDNGTGIWCFSEDESRTL